MIFFTILKSIGIITIGLEKSGANVSHQAH